MNKAAFTILTLVCLVIVARADYKSEEMYVLPWGWETEQEIPYSEEEDGAAFSVYMAAADLAGNIYLAFPYRDFRKYDNSGKLVFRKEIKIAHFAVDDSQTVYFTKLDPDQMHILRVLNKNGELYEKKINFKVGNEIQRINWIRNRKGSIFVGNLKYTAIAKDLNLSMVTRQLNDPIDSKGIFYYTDTAMGKSDREQTKSFAQIYIDLIQFHLADGKIVRRDTVSLNICTAEHRSAEITEVDKNDNIYVWIYYNLDLPIDFVILDSSLKEIDRIELVPIAESKGLWLRPYVMPDGTIYEFRDLDDGLHVIRWSRKE